jgi:oligoribonuclease NrnB/cAMP/cGMP phosphodiesterase (DHH superfamily)
MFSHTDLDGVGCYIVALYTLGRVNVEFCNPSYINEKVLKFIRSGEVNQYSDVYITDISVTDVLATEINDMFSGKFHLIDHHPTAEFLNKYVWAKVIVNDDVEQTCATALLYEFTKNGVVGFSCQKNFEKFVQHVRRYDTWTFRTKYHDEEPKKWNDLLYMMGREDFVTYVMDRISEPYSLCLGDIADTILNIEQKRIDSYVDSIDEEMIFKTILGHKAGVVFAESYTSELGNRLCEKHPDLDFVAIIKTNGTVSYRTIKEGIDVGREVALHYGGGGHSKASGNQYSIDLIDDLVNKIFDG